MKKLFYLVLSLFVVNCAKDDDFVKETKQTQQEIAAKTSKFDTETTKAISKNFCAATNYLKTTRSSKVDRKKFWEYGKIVTVSVIGASKTLKDFLPDLFLNYINPNTSIRFKYVSNNGTIRISTNPLKPNWSLIGNEALNKKDLTKATMNIAAEANADFSSEELTGKLIHLFGHALGAIHEHLKTPLRSDHIDSNQIITYFTQARPYNGIKINLGKAKNAISLFKINTTNSEAKNPKINLGSIMRAPLPFQFLNHENENLNKVHIDFYTERLGNLFLSKADQTLFKNMFRENRYVVGDWNGNGFDNIAIIRGNTFIQDTRTQYQTIDRNSTNDTRSIFFIQSNLDRNDSPLLVCDWNQDGKDEFAVVKNHCVLKYELNNNSSFFSSSFNFCGQTESINDGEYFIANISGKGDVLHSRIDNFFRPILDIRNNNNKYASTTNGQANFYDEYFYGNWDGNALGKETVAARKDNRIFIFNSSGKITKEFFFGKGNNEDQYLVGDFNGDNKTDFAIRRGNLFIVKTNFNVRHNQIRFHFGRG